MLKDHREKKATSKLNGKELAKSMDKEWNLPIIF